MTLTLNLDTAPDIRLVPPTMAEINGKLAGTTGLKAFSTFAGTGGSSTGYKWAGFDMIGASEFVPEAIESYTTNHPSTRMFPGDIRALDPVWLLNELGLDQGELDLFDGSPPCQSFSTSGKRHKKWGQEHQYSGSIGQRTDDLFMEYVRMVDGLHPKVFVAENVAGLVGGQAQGYFKEIWEKLSVAGPGYTVGAQLLRADRMGIPQIRPRVIIVGVRSDLAAAGKVPVFPKPWTPPVPLGPALRGMPEPEPGDFQFMKPGSRTHQAWANSNIWEENGCLRAAYKRIFAMNARFNWFRVNPYKPCPTIPAKVPCLLRWDEPRTFTTPEIKRIQSFPEDFNVTGSFAQRWERVGRAVPPAMMMQVAKTIAREIFGR